MKSLVTSFILFLIISLLHLNNTYAQCNAPTFSREVITPAYCFGKGIIDVDSVAEIESGVMVQYRLRYDSSNNTAIYRQFQDTNVFLDVARGRYTLEIQKLCSTGNSSIFSKRNIVVGGASELLEITNIRPIQKSVCGNGSFVVSAKGGNSFFPYKYALIPSMNAYEGTFTYVMPPQADSHFYNLPAGTYYIRVYDSCGNFSTASTNISGASDTAILVASRNDYSFYGCDSIQVKFHVRTFHQVYTSLGGMRIQHPNERFWISYNNNTDTFRDVYYSNTLYNDSSYSTFSSYTTKILKNITYPIIVTYGYKSICGDIFTLTDTIVKPKLKLAYMVSAIDCNTNKYTINTRDSLSGISNYSHTYLSVDGGLTWSNFNTNSSYTENFQTGQTKYIVVANNCDTIRDTVHSLVRILRVHINLFNANACHGNGGFSISLNNGNFSGIKDSVYFTTLQQPNGAMLPSNFYFYQNAAYQLSHNLPPGIYKFAAIDQCGAKDTIQINVTPVTISYTVQELKSCLAINAGFRIIMNELNYNPYSGYTYYKAAVRNITTNRVDTFTSHSQTIRPTYIDIVNMGLGQLEIIIFKDRRRELPRYECPIDTILVNSIGGPLQISHSFMTSACSDNTATISLTAAGGGGTYEYTLQEQINNVWTNIRNPQILGLFNNLNPLASYRIFTTDTCGNGVYFNVSFNGDPLPYTFSSNLHPCEGEDFSIILPQYTEAIYSWYKNNNLIPLLDSNKLMIQNMPANTIDRYRAVVSFGSCDIVHADVVLNSNKCNMALPVLLKSFATQIVENDVVLDWTTMSERDNAKFIIERSSKNSDWIAIGEVMALNNNITNEFINKYSFVDKQPLKGENLYRLKQVDINGEANYSPISMVLLKDFVYYQITPNPANDLLKIIGWHLNTKFDITDMLGRSVGFDDVDMQFGIIDISKLTAGTYILKISDSKTGVTELHKFVKN